MSISSTHLRDLIEANGYIPDHLLGEYLADKITVKPDYGYSTEPESQLEGYREQMRLRGKQDAARAAEKKRAR